MEMRFLVETKT